MNRNRIALLLGALVILVGAVALVVSQNLSGGAHARSHASSFPRNLTNVETFLYEVGERLTQTRLRIQLEAEAGTAVWTLTDPEGAARWEGRLEAGERLDESRDFAPIVGEWRLELDMEGFTGHYDTLWEGSG